MGKKDNRRSRKMLRKKAQVKKKAARARKIAGATKAPKKVAPAKATKTTTKKSAQ
ncbi:MAG: hypothetical protein RJB13_850 [Pseudomonadota bacterium]|jgi:hypothetical protein